MKTLVSTLACLVLLTSSSTLRAADENPIYETLTGPGVSITPEASVKLAPPVMPDGLDADAQHQAALEVAGSESVLDDMQRRSPVARDMRHLDSEAVEGYDGIIRKYDAYFYAHGDLNKFRDPKFLEKVFGGGEGQGAGGELTQEELATKGVTLADKKHESYGWGTFDLRGQVSLQIVGRVFWSESPESITVAGMMDPRFTGVGPLSNQWQPIVRNKPGAAVPYDGPAAFYLKATKSQHAADGLFIEFHCLVAEPTGWFQGRNTISSVFPQVMQSWIRDTRKELLKAAAAEGGN
jgi:hypothetical protein